MNDRSTPWPDYDGDTFSVTPEETHQSYLIKEHISELGFKFRSAKFKDKVDILFKHGLFNKSKFKSMSKRRQKKFVFGFGLYFNVTENKLVHSKYSQTVGVSAIPIIMHYVEETGVAFNNLLTAWTDFCLKL